MTVKLTPFDPADHLHDEEDMAAYLAATAEDGDEAEILAALNTIARARNLAKLARDTGLTRAGIYKALGPNGNPSFGVVMKVARAMGFGMTFVPLGNQSETLVTADVRLVEEIAVRKDVVDHVETVSRADVILEGLTGLT